MKKTSGLFILIFAICLFLSCKNSDEINSHEMEDEDEEMRIPDEDQPFGKYIYMDTKGVLHSKRHCVKLITGITSGIHPIDTAFIFINKDEELFVCSRCINDNQYAKLLKLIDREFEHGANRRELFKFLSKDSILPPIELFEQRLKNETVLRELFLDLQEKDYCLDYTFPEFSNKLGYKYNTLGL